MESPLLSVQTKPADKKQLSHLPLLRFTNLATVFVALDSLFSISLWLAGGDSQYLEDSVKDFSLLTSTFDLASLAAVRGVLIIACLYYLEHYTLVSVSSILEKKQLISRRLAGLCHILLLIFPLVSCVYAVVKGALILAKLGSVSEELHITYKILCIVAIVIPAMEVAIAVSSICFMWRLTHILKLRIAAHSTEEEVGEEKKKSKADLKRIALLAVPVSIVHPSVVKNIHR